MRDIGIVFLLALLVGVVRICQGGLVDDFETGDYNSTWTITGGDVVLLNGNYFLQHQASQHSRFDLPTPIGSGGSDTIYLRHRYDFSFDEGGIRYLGYDSGGTSTREFWADGAFSDQTSTLEADIWYDTWFLLDAANDEMKVYLEGGEFTSPTLVATNPIDAGEGIDAFQLQATSSFGGVVLYDDIWQLPGNSVGVNPNTVPEPSAAYLVGFALVGLVWVHRRRRRRLSIMQRITLERVFDLLFRQRYRSDK